MPRVLRGHISVKLVLIISLLLVLTSLPSGFARWLDMVRPTAKAATTFTVNSTGDGSDINPADGVCNDGSGVCTLRAAIQEANAASGADTINFSLAANSIITLNTQLPAFIGNISIVGTGSSLLTIQRSFAAGTPVFPVFNFAPINGNFNDVVSGLTVLNGSATGDAGSNMFGGGIVNFMSSTLTLTDVVISGSTSTNGGGFFNGGTATLTNCKVTGNNSPNGGGILNGGSGVLTIINSTVSNNVASNSSGGGILNAGGTVTITGSTVSGNTCDAQGGGIFNKDGFNGAGSVTLTNSTVSGNNATGILSNGVGGISNNAGANILTLINTTVTANIASGSGSGVAGIFNGSGSTANLKNSIVAQNTSPLMLHDLNGTFNSQGYNLIGKSDGTNGFTNGVNGDQVGTYATPVDPKLGVLTDNAGLTKTHALLVGSPAIDAGNSALLNDQRGQPRPVDDQTVVNAAGGNATDIGAYEAHNLEVNSTADADDGACRALGTGNGCTLREALNAANAEPGAELITFAPALTSGGSATINLSTALPDLSTNMTIVGPGASLLTIRRASGAPTNFRIFRINSGNVSISGLTMTNGKEFNGGAIYNATTGTVSITSSTLTGNVADGDGGAIYNLGTSTFTITNSTLSGNTSVSYAGGLMNATSGTVSIVNTTFNGNTGGIGGAMANTSAGKIRLTNSTVSANSSGNGGGIYAAGVVSIVNSTFSGNSANNEGGGVYNVESGILTVINSTFTNNRSDVGNFGFGSGGGIFQNVGVGFVLLLRNTIVAGNFKGSNAGATRNDVKGPVDAQSTSNFIGDGSGMTGISNGGNGNQVGTSLAPIDPGLGPLASNGGPTQTQALLPGSPAIDAGDNCVLNNTCAPPLTSAITTDQRGTGFNRAADGNGDGTTTVDIGAFEVQSILVTNTSDTGAGSLRQAIIDSNANPSSAAINFQLGLTGTITLSSALPDIASSITINGPGASQLTIQRSAAGGTPNFRVFTVNSGTTVSISGLTITNGRTADGVPGPGTVAGGQGGGISSSGTLTLNNTIISGNRTGIGSTNGTGGTDGVGGVGGGIYNVGTLTLNNSTVSGNTTGAGGPSSQGGSGGGIYNLGTLTLNDTTISGNQTGNGGNGTSQGGYGGGIFNGSPGILTLTNSTVSNNQTGTGGTFAGTGGGISCAGTATLNNSTVTGNHTGNGNGYGAGISTTATLILTNSTISNNITGAQADGAGIRVDGGTVTATNSIISGNQTSPGGEGGGMDSVHPVTLVNCLITNNTSGTAGGLNIGSSSPSMITNSTISGNTSTGAGGGLRFGGTLTLTNVTITNNRSDSDNSGGEQGGGIDRFVGTLTLKNTLVAGNFRGSSPSTTADDIMGTIDPTSSFNLIGTGGSGGLTNGVNNNQVGVANPRLGPLAGNGGLSQTHALLSGSTALDAGNNAFVANPPFSGPPFTDQRGAGFARIVDGPDADTTGTVDIGAFEAQLWVQDIADQTINEDGSLSLPFNVGGAASITSVTATSSDTTLVPNNPANISISGSGSSRTLVINPAANAFGTSTITVTVNGNNSQTMTDTLLLTVNPVNDAPSFMKGLDQTVNENDAAQTVNNWASNISAGPANESGQALSFVIVSNNNASLFAVAPAISPTGTLTYTPATGASGTALITLALRDNGGTANGGLDTSATQSFNINVRDGGTLSFSAAAYNFAEDGGSAAITINRSGGSAGTATVLFATSNGTATAGDYTSISQTINFNDGEVSKSVSVPITDDLFNEPNETINLALSNAGGSGQLGSQISAVLTIVDNDPVGGYLHFSAFDNNTTENSGVTPIGVERLGTTTQAVTVNYATSDASSTVPCSTANGIASSRCDFTPAIGTLHFAAGETFKVILVLISQDNFVEGPETLTLTLSNVTGGAALATPATVPLTIADDATEPATNPIDTADAFVRQHYHDFLNREPDPDGLAFWSNQITECQQPGATCSTDVRRFNVSAAFFLSIEFQETGYLVERIYKASYGDATGTSTLGGAHQLAVPVVRFNEFLPDTQTIGQGVVVGQTGWEQVLENNKQAFTEAFVQRTRFATAYQTSMTPAQFVDALFANAGVTPSTTDRNAALNEFGGAGNTADPAARGRALRRVAENSTLNQQEKNKAFVLMQYLGYLRRNPNDAPDSDYTGYDFWLNKLNEFNGNFVNAEMVKAFLVSGEYRQRFGP